MEEKTWDGQQDREKYEYGQGAGQRDTVRNNGTGSKTERQTRIMREKDRDHEKHRGLEKEREVLEALQRYRG